jgi:hypothetical protein
LCLHGCAAPPRQEGNSKPEVAALIIYIQPPGTVPKNLTFEYERSREDVQKLKAGVETLKKGDSEADVVRLLGPPNRQGTSAPKESTKITGYFYVYDVRLVKTGTANVFDQQVSCNFDPRTGKLLQIESTVPEIR